MTIDQVKRKKITLLLPGKWHDHKTVKNVEKKKKKKEKKEEDFLKLFLKKESK